MTLDASILEPITKILPYVASSVGALLGILRPSEGSRRQRRLDAEYEVAKKFAEDGHGQHNPILAVRGFAAVLGRPGLNAEQVAFVRRQRDPLQFAQWLLASKGYLKIDANGQGASWASGDWAPRWFKLLKCLYFGVYLVAVVIGGGIFLENLAHLSTLAAPVVVARGVTAVALAVVATTALLEGRRITFAERVMKDQCPPNNRA